MKLEIYNNRLKGLRHVAWYKGYNGIMLFQIKLLGFSIHNEKVVVQLVPNIMSKTSSGLWIYFIFWQFYIEIKNPWKRTKYE